LSKKLPVLNSPWGRSHERISDCQRWIAKGDAVLIHGALEFTERFFKKVERDNMEFDPIGYDDGTARRWVRAESGAPCPGEMAVNGQLLGGRDRDIPGIRARKGKLIVISPSGIGVKQLLPVKRVGTGRFVSKRADTLMRRYR
jgi:hypothetical protein